MIAFTVWAIVTLVLLRRSIAAGAGWPRIGLFALATGVLIALAVGSKMNALIVPALAGLFGLAAAWKALRRGDRSAGREVVALAAAILIGGLGFVALDPTLWPDVRGGIDALVNEPRYSMLLQSTFDPTHLPTLGPRLPAIATLLAGGAIPFLLLIALAEVEVVQVLRKPDDPTLLAWWILAFSLIVVWLPFPRESYILPLVPPTTLLAAKAIVDLSDRRLWRRTNS
jgi:hypothetical protein